MKILDIGCGNKKYKGEIEDVVIGMDRMRLPSVDVIYDIEKFPYPYKSEVFDKIVMQHSLEHVSKENMANIKIIEEIHRVLKGDGILEVEVPIGHWFKYDPTHKNYVGFWYWKYFSENFPMNFYSHTRFKVLEYNLVGLAGAKFATTLKPFACWLYKKNPERMERIIDMVCLDATIKYKLKKVRSVS
jgi:predicted SAM-dependent methyltransferase